MVAKNVNEYKIGNVTVRSRDFFKSETEEALRMSVQSIIARLICMHESNELTTYYTS